jgi:hypothetical protein
MFPRFLSVLAGGLVALAWTLGSTHSTAAADERNASALQVQSAVGTSESPDVQLVDHRRHRRHHHHHHRGGVSVYLGSPGYYYPDYGYSYSYPRSYYYPRRYYYYDTGYRTYDPYYGSYYYYRW